MRNSSRRDRRPWNAATLEPFVGLTVYDCAPDEEALFRQLAPQFGVTLRMTDLAASGSAIDLASGNRCISVSHKAPVSRSTLQGLADAGIRFISTRSAGTDHIDVDVARQLDITVEGVEYSSDGVADYTVMLMLMALRNARSVITRTEVGDFRLAGVRGKELHDLTVGVVGTGRIGSAVVDRLRPFGCRILTHDRTAKSAAEHVDLDELLSRSDIVTLHTPLTAETFHLLNRDRIALMKPGAFVINTGRGALIDTEALVDALEDGRLGGAGLDVVEGEDGIFYTDRRGRSIENETLRRVLRMPNVVVTPHTAYYTENALSDTVTNTLRNCIEFERSRHA
ncbi:D-isomer specific 2-hydroxyacid dehydrogenase family protein [Humibacter soli]